MPYLFALTMFMIVVGTRRKLASLGQGGVALPSRKAQGGHAWTALGCALGVSCLACLASPQLSGMQIQIGDDALPLWAIPFTGGFAWFLISLVSNRW